MAILNRRALLGGAGSALTIMAAPAIGKGKTVLVQRTTDSYPRCIRMPNGRWSGFEVEISRDMCKLADVGFTAAEEYFPWSRSLRMIESGELQLLPAVSYREERNLYMDYIGVYDIEEIVVVVHKENAGVRFDTLDDFTKPGQIFERVETAVFTPEFDERIRTDPSFSSHFIGTVGSGSGDRFELLNALGTRVYRGRVFGALTDWYSFAAVQISRAECGGTGLTRMISSPFGPESSARRPPGSPPAGQFHWRCGTDCAMPMSPCEGMAPSPAAGADGLVTGQNRLLRSARGRARRAVPAPSRDLNISKRERPRIRSGAEPPFEVRQE